LLVNGYFAWIYSRIDDLPLLIQVVIIDVTFLIVIKVLNVMAFLHNH
jgi:hypothetical protein